MISEKQREMKTFELIIFKNPLKARGHPMNFEALKSKMLTSKA
jgi:hypothetical protein